jgi:hypothetical protein
MADFAKLQESGDDFMRSGNYHAANEAYHAAWKSYAEQRNTAATAGNLREFDTAYPANGAFWRLMNGADAQFRAGDFEACLDTCTEAFNLFKDLGFVVGNPFFHLRVGQASFELEQPDARDENGMAMDNLARALICGGIEIFKHEEPKYLNPVLDVLRPPEGYSSWQEAQSQGCSVDMLNGATGFLADTFAAKYGVAPPFPQG